MDRVDCTVFEDQLDSLVRGELPESGVAQLRAHAARCPECATQLRMREHLVTPSLADLEAQVPDAWVTSMWNDVQAAVAVPGAAVRRRNRWAVPLLAAALVALLFANGLALRALARAENRAEDLASQLLDQQRRLVSLQGERESGLPGVLAGFAGRGSALRALEDRTDLTVAELRALLQELPAQTPLIGAARTRQLARSPFVPSVWRDAMSRLDTGGEVTAGALLTVLDDLDIPGDATVPAARIFELLT
ncbi:MAG TPA: zf-HC2 domain-containing protein [Longimicrobiales bacterium]|nr:zf-HC2 domain-containing protein [Longimicrobiales bacterium]